MLDGLPAAERPALWLADRLAQTAATAAVRSTGFAALDAELPGGGWPAAGLTELLLAAPGSGELRLLAPLLGARARTRRQPAVHRAALHAVRAGAAGARLAARAPAARQRPVHWPTRPGPPSKACARVRAQRCCGGSSEERAPAAALANALRRLHLAAQEGRCPLFALRPAAARAQSSPAPLRLALEPVAQRQLAVTVFKRRGPAMAAPLLLALPVAGLPTRRALRRVPALPAPAAAVCWPCRSPLMLWLALHLNALPLEALLAALPAAPQAASRRAAWSSSGACCWPAASPRAAGVQPGMSAASAASLLPGLQLLPRDAAREAAFVERLALALARYTPAVVIEPDGVLLEGAASLRLFGGARALARAVRATVRASGVHAAQMAVAPTAGAASLLARLTPGESPRRGTAHGCRLRASPRQSTRCWPGTSTPASASMPCPWPPRSPPGNCPNAWPNCCTASAAARWPTCARCRAPACSGAAAASCSNAWPRPTARHPTRAPGSRRRAGFELGLELLHRADDAAMLVFAAERLVQPLAGWLAQQWLAASRIALHLRHETSRRQALPDTVVRIGLGEPSREARQIGLLLRERLQRTALPAPVYALTLRLEEAVEPRRPRGRPVARPAAPRHDDDRRGLIDRLGARLGPERVQRLHLLADHRPERAMAAVPANAAAAAGLAATAAAGPAAPDLAAARAAAPAGTSRPPAARRPAHAAQPRRAHRSRLVRR